MNEQTEFGRLGRDSLDASAPKNRILILGGGLWRGLHGPPPGTALRTPTGRIIPLAAAGQGPAKLIKAARLLVVNGGPNCIAWTHAEEGNAELLSSLDEKTVNSKP